MSLINLSDKLQITDVKLTGQLSDLFLENFLNNGMMFASFNSKGTTPSFNDTLNTLASGIMICSTVLLFYCSTVLLFYCSTSSPLFS